MLSLLPQLIFGEDDDGSSRDDVISGFAFCLEMDSKRKELVVLVGQLMIFAFSIFCRREAFCMLLASFLLAPAIFSLESQKDTSTWKPFRGLSSEAKIGHCSSFVIWFFLLDKAAFNHSPSNKVLFFTSYALALP